MTLEAGGRSDTAVVGRPGIGGGGDRAEEAQDSEAAKVDKEALVVGACAWLKGETEVDCI